MVGGLAGVGVFGCGCMLLGFWETRAWLVGPFLGFVGLVRVFLRSFAGLLFWWFGVGCVCTLETTQWTRASRMTRAKVFWAFWGLKGFVCVVLFTYGLDE